MQDSNLRPSAPKADALPNCANPRIDGSGVMRLIGRNRDLTSILALLLGYLPSESPQAFALAKWVPGASAAN